MVLEDDELIEALGEPDVVERVVGYVENEGLMDEVFERVGQRDRLGLCVVDPEDDMLNDVVLVAFDEAILEMLGDIETLADGETESGTFTEIPINEDGTHEDGGDDTLEQGRAYTPNCIAFPSDA